MPQLLWSNNEFSSSGLSKTENQEVEESPEIEGKLLTLKEVAEQTGYSPVRLRALILEGKVNGVRGDRHPQGGPKRWFTTIEAVEKYRSDLPSPSDFGRKGAARRWKKDL